MMTDYAQLFIFVFYWLLMKLYGFDNFVEQHLVPYEYAGINLEASKWLLCRGGFYGMTVINKLR